MERHLYRVRLGAHNSPQILSRLAALGAFRKQLHLPDLQVRQMDPISESWSVLCRLRAWMEDDEKLRTLLPQAGARNTPEWRTNDL
jgi:hypothetical protein